MKIVHKCEECYLKDLCKNYLYNKSWLLEFNPDYYNYDFLSIELSCIHKNGRNHLKGQINCNECRNRDICTAYNTKEHSSYAVEYLKKQVDNYIDIHFRNAFDGRLICQGFALQDATIR